MTVETRAALLVGLAVIILFGLVLSQRSVNVSGVSGEEVPSRLPPARPGGEVMAPRVDQPTAPRVLSPPPSPRSPDNVGRRQAPPAGAGEPAPADPASRVPLARPAAPPVSRQPRPAPRAAPVRPRTYTVRPRDNLTAIARRVYGAGHEDEYLRIYRANRDKLPDEGTLSVGQVLVIPTLAAEARPRERLSRANPPRRHFTEVTLEALAERFGRGGGPRSYVVRPGDCLTGIARKNMGDAGRQAVRRLYEANRDRVDDPDHLPVGLKLRIPS